MDWPRVTGLKQKLRIREAAIAKCMNSIAAVIGRSMKIDVVPRKWSAKFCNTPVKFDRCDRKPGVVLMNAVNVDSPEKTQTWPDIYATGEDKDGQTLGNAMEELAQGARLIFGTQPDRIAVVGFIIHQDNLVFVIFNRSGVFMSDPFDVDKNPERLIRVVGGMIFATREQIGFDPTIKITPYNETAPFIPYVEVNGNKYEIVQLLHVECVIRGRATVCFRVKKKVDKNVVSAGRDKHFVVKTGWVNHSQKLKEPDILKTLNERGVKGIPTVYESQIFGETTWGTFMEMTKFMTEIEQRDLGIGLEDRQQVRVVTGPVGSSILEFKSLKELVHGFLTIVESESQELHFSTNF